MDRFSRALPEPSGNRKTAARAQQGKVQLQPRSRRLGRRISPCSRVRYSESKHLLLPLAFRQASPRCRPRRAPVRTPPPPETPAAAERQPGSAPTTGAGKLLFSYLEVPASCKRGRGNKGVFQGFVSPFFVCPLLFSFHTPPPPPSPMSVP